MNFINYTGIWIPITLSNFYAGTRSAYFPAMLDTTVNRVQLVTQTTFIMPILGIQLTQFSIGYDTVALFAQIRFYNRYIHQPFGKLMSTSDTQVTGQVNVKLLTGNQSTNCIADAELSTNTVTSLGLTCVGDYVKYFELFPHCKIGSKYST